MREMVCSRKLVAHSNIEWKFPQRLLPSKRSRAAFITRLAKPTADDEKEGPPVTLDTISNAWRQVQLPIDEEVMKELVCSTVCCNSSLQHIKPVHFVQQAEKETAADPMSAMSWTSGTKACLRQLTNEELR